MSDTLHPFIARYDEVFRPEYPLSPKALWRTLGREELVRVVRNAFSPFYDEVRKAYQEELAVYENLVKQHEEALKIPPVRYSSAEMVMRFIKRQPLRAPDPPSPPALPLCPSYQTVFGEVLKDACAFIEELNFLMREQESRTRRNIIDLTQFTHRMKEVERELSVMVSQTR